MNIEQQLHGVLQRSGETTHPIALLDAYREGLDVLESLFTRPPGAPTDPQPLFAAANTLNNLQRTFRMGHHFSVLSSDREAMGRLVGETIELLTRSPVDFSHREKILKNSRERLEESFSSGEDEDFPSEL
ncbi:MAG TPA: hypothetical protein VJB82_02700 [Candidatus Peribacterales bacterium]|nr:hypothetical protein [Candidatus Peribacterales bacterium]